MESAPFDSWRNWRDETTSEQSPDCIPVRRGTQTSLCSHPATRFDHAIVSDPEGIYLFGGVSLDGRIPFYKNDLWYWNYNSEDGKQWSRQQHLNRPSARGGHTLVLRDDRTVILFAGQNTNGELSDCYSLDLSLNPLKWTKLHPGHLPPRRVGHTACLYKSTYMIIHGGKGPQGQLSDTWILNFDTVTWRSIATSATPKPRWLHTCSINNSRMFIFGGGVQHPGESLVLDSNHTYSIDVNDLVNYSLSRCQTHSPAWTKHSPTGELPKARRQHSSSTVYTPFNGFIIYGGVTTSTGVLDSERGDINYYCATRDCWTFVKAPRGYKRWGHTATVNRKTKNLIAIGGNASPALRFDPQTGCDLLKDSLYFDCSEFLTAPQTADDVVLSPHRGKLRTRQKPDFQKETRLPPEQCNITFGSLPIHKGNSFGISVDRYYLSGDFKADAFRRLVASQQREHNYNILTEKHNPRSTGCIDWRRADAGQKSNLLLQVGQLKKAAERAKLNIVRLTDPCSQCGSILDAICTPCGHAGVCLICAVDDNLSHCPICKEPVLRVLRMFSEAYESLRKKIILETPTLTKPASKQQSPDSTILIKTDVSIPTNETCDRSQSGVVKKGPRPQSSKLKLKSLTRPKTAVPRKSLWCTTPGMI